MATDTTPPRLRAALTALATACENDPALLAAWVGGSLARGDADDWSDIDLNVLAHDAAEFARRLPHWFAQVMPVVLADQIPGVAGGFIFVTPDWVHVDLVVHRVVGFDQDTSPAHVLFDRAGLVSEVQAADEPGAGEPYEPDGAPQRFLYFMGNLVTVAHRGEWLALAQGTAMMRDSLLIPLMLAENGVRKTDGAKRLNRYLTAEQVTALQSLPPVGSEPSQLLAAQHAIASEYIRRGKRLAAQLGADWPADLEAAVRSLWRRELGIDLR